MTDIPSPLTYATITCDFASILADSIDAGEAPDWTTAIQGTVTITPSVHLIRVTGTPAIMAIAANVAATVVDGQLLGPDGVTPLRILATDSPGINPVAFQYTAAFSLSGVAAQPPTIIFNAPGGTVVDLASIIPASTAPAIQTVVSEASAIAAAASAVAAEAAADRAEAAATIDPSDYVLTTALTSILTSYPLDSDVVHDTGAETIAGVKTFSSAPVVPSASFPESAITNLTTDLAAKAALASPTFTGTPSLPTGTTGTTQTAGDNTTKLATTAFVTTADALKANLASPTFTGTPAAPTATGGTNTTQIATTAFVTAAITALGGAGVWGSITGTLSSQTDLASALSAKAVDSAVVHLTGAETVAGVKTFSSAPVVPAASFPESAVTNLTTDLAAKAADSAVVHLTGAETVAGIKTFSSAPVVPSASFPESAITNLTTDLAAKAPLASPTFTGTPALPTGTTAVTQTAADNSTKIATTAYVDTADALKATLASPTFTGTPSLPTGTTGVTQTAADSTTKLATTAFVTTADNLKANLASPTFTGTPALPTGTTAVTQTAADNSTKIATTAYADAIATLKANLASPTFTGTPAAPTASAGTNTTQLATTAFVTTAANARGSLSSGLQPVAEAVAGVMLFVDWNFTTSAWPVRPTSRTDVVCVWRGPAQPTIGSGYSVAGLDMYYLKTS